MQAQREAGTGAAMRHEAAARQAAVARGADASDPAHALRRTTGSNSNSQARAPLAIPSRPRPAHSCALPCLVTAAHITARLCPRVHAHHASRSPGAVLKRQSTPSAAQAACTPCACDSSSQVQEVISPQPAKLCCSKMW